MVCNMCGIETFGFQATPPFLLNNRKMKVYSQTQICSFGKNNSNTGFFLKATLWPDFTELFFRFSGVKTGDFYLT